MSIWAFSVRRWQFTLVLFGLLIAVGVNSFLNIPRSEDPEFHVPIPTVVAVYPGADPVDIERLVVDPIEDALNELDDIKRMDSRSLDGVGVIQPEFHWHTDADEKFDEVVREVNRIRDQLPADLASLEVRKAGSGLVNIVQVALVSEDASYRELQKLAEDLRDSIETVPGVRRQRVLGCACARGARGARPRTHGARRRDARPGRDGRPRRERHDTGRRGGRRPAQVQPQDLGRLRLARRSRGDRGREPRRPHRQAARRRRRELGSRRGTLCRPVQRQARGVRHRERQGSSQRLRRARRHLPEARRVRARPAAGRRPRARLRPEPQRESPAEPPRPRLPDRDRPRRADAAAARAARVGRRDDLDPAVARDRAVAALLHRVLAQPAVHRRLRAGARAAGGRFDRGRGEHLAVPARRLLAVRCGDRGHRPDRARGARLHRHAAVRLPAAAVPPGRRRQVHPFAAGCGALHGAGVAAGRAHGDPVPRQPHPASRGPRRRRQPRPEGADVGDPPDLFAGAQGRAREPAPDTARGAGASWPRPSRWCRSSA